MKKRRVDMPLLFGALARWSERQRCWIWRVSTLTASLNQTPRGGWWVAGAVNGTRISSRTHAEPQRAVDEFERDIRGLHSKLSALLRRGGNHV